MDIQPCVFLGIKLAAGPIERYKIENFSLDNTVDHLKSEAQKKTNVPSSSLELIHHGKILKDEKTLQDSGIKNGEMVHVVKKKEQPPPEAPQPPSDAELQQILTSLRTFGCTPNAPGWTRAMQMLNDEATVAEIIDAVPSLGEECVTLSILHEVELLAALGASLQTMRRGAHARPDLLAALRQLIRLVQSRSNNTGTNLDNAPTSGFAYSLEALSEDEEGDEEEDQDAERNIITQEQLVAALQAATEAVSSSGSRVGSSHASQNSLLRLMQGSGEPSQDASSTNEGTPTSSGGSNQMITPAMFTEAIARAINRNDAPAPMEQSANESGFLFVPFGVETLGTWGPEAHSLFKDISKRLIETSGDKRAGSYFGQRISLAIQRASSSGSPQTTRDRYVEQLLRMHELGLTDDTLNIRALLICSGNVNDAINLVFSGVIGDD